MSGLNTLCIVVILVKKICPMFYNFKIVQYIVTNYYTVRGEVCWNKI